MEITVREMTLRDKDCVLAMMRVFYASPAVHTNGSEEIFENDFNACVCKSPYFEGYVMESEGKIRGYAMVAKSFSAEFGKPCVWIEDLYIREDSRGLGIGKKFIGFITEKYAGCVFRLEVEAENERAVGLYKNSGFSVLPYMEMVR